MLSSRIPRRTVAAPSWGMNGGAAIAGRAIGVAEAGDACR
jgi:hypothetical protein